MAVTTYFAETLNIKSFWLVKLLLNLVRYRPFFDFAKKVHSFLGFSCLNLHVYILYNMCWIKIHGLRRALQQYYNLIPSTGRQWE